MKLLNVKNEHYPILSLHRMIHINMTTKPNNIKLICTKRTHKLCFQIVFSFDISQIQICHQKWFFTIKSQQRMKLYIYHLRHALFYLFTNLIEIGNAVKKTMMKTQEDNCSTNSNPFLLWLLKITNTKNREFTGYVIEIRKKLNQKWTKP